LDNLANLVPSKVGEVGGASKKFIALHICVKDFLEYFIDNLIIRMFPEIPGIDWCAVPGKNVTTTKSVLLPHGNLLKNKLPGTILDFRVKN
jgi:hypothetical protein